MRLTAGTRRRQSRHHRRSQPIPPPFLPSTPKRDSAAIRALLAPWRAEQGRDGPGRLQILALEFQIEPLTDKQRQEECS